MALARRPWAEVEAGPAALLLFDLGGEVYVTADQAAWLSQGGSRMIASLVRAIWAASGATGRS